MSTEAPKLELDTDSWGMFKLDKLFNIELGKGPYIKNIIEDKSGIHVIGFAAINEGFLKLAQPGDWKVHKGNCITQPITGSQWCSYREPNQDFFVTNSHTLILRLKDNFSRDLTPNISQFLITLLRLLTSSKYNGNHKIGPPRFKKETINLPQTSTGEPDWDFMENYIEQLKEDIPEIPEVQEPTLKLDVDNWDEFNMSDLFNIEKLKGLRLTEKVEEVNGGIPLVNTGMTNEGVIKTIKRLSNFVLYDRNCLTFSSSGSRYPVYREQDFYVVNSSIYRITLKTYLLNRKIGLFMSIVMRRIFNLKYSFAREISLSRFKKETIKLPTTSNGTPDWDFMERYIKEIEGASSN